MKRSNHRQAKPRLESLEAIAPPAAGAAGAAAHAAVSAAINHGPHLGLEGTFQGTYTQVFINPDAGRQQSLVGTGRLENLGAFKLTGTLHTPGFIARGHAAGTLTLANTKGTIKVSLVGPTEPGFGGIPSSFTYSITGGSGKYFGAHGNGVVTLADTNNAATGPFTMRFH